MTKTVTAAELSNIADWLERGLDRAYASLELRVLAKRLEDEPTCDHAAPSPNARWCSKCGALYDGSEWLFPSNAPNR